MASPIMEAARREISSAVSQPLTSFRVSPVLIPMLLLTCIPGEKKNPKSCESASLVLQNAFWKCLCAGMPTRKFERDPAS